MCINPRIHPNGLQTPCHQCWQCRENRINDWVGRCIAEKETSLACTVVTLTYGGGDTPESRFLRKSDLTAYLKAIRNDGHKVRFFGVGEYGSKKGRAHWHVVLFWQSKMPHREIRKNITDEWWPHGFSHWDNCDVAGIRYVMKYITKVVGDDAHQKSMGMSRKPVLGYWYFCELADRYIEQGLAPQRPFYKFREALTLDGRPIEFYMPPLVRDQFCGIYIAKWLAKYPGKHWPVSDMLDTFHDKTVGYVPPINREARRFRSAPWMAPPAGGEERFDEKLNSFYCEVDGQRLYWSFDERGQRVWQKEIVTEQKAEQLQAEYAARKLLEARSFGQG